MLDDLVGDVQLGTLLARGITRPRPDVVHPFKEVLIRGEYALPVSVFRLPNDGVEVLAPRPLEPFDDDLGHLRTCALPVPKCPSVGVSAAWLVDILPSDLPKNAFAFRARLLRASHSVEGYFAPLLHNIYGLVVRLLVDYEKHVHQVAAVAECGCYRSIGCTADQVFILTGLDETYCMGP